MLGIFGGTFDPIHIGHLRTAFELRARLGLSEVRMVLSASPPHREPPVAGAAERWRMLELALDDREHHGLVADRREIERSGPSYMVETLAQVRAEFAGVPVCLLLGMDAFTHLDRWHRWTDLPGLAHLVVATRPGAAAALTDDVSLRWNLTDDPARLRQSLAGELLVLTMTQLDVSASGIRQQIAAGIPADFLTPPAVADYIREQRLYQ